MHRLLIPSLALLFLLGCNDTTEREITKTSRARINGIVADAVPGLTSPSGKDGKGSMAERDFLRFRDPVSGRIPAGMRGRELNFVADLSGQADQFHARRSASQIDLGAWEWLGPDGTAGRTRALAFDAGGGYIIAGSVSGGLFRMDNHEDSVWVKRSSPGANQNVTAIAQDARVGYSQNWYYATGELRGAPGRGRFRNSMGSGVYKSTDSGRSWNPLPSTQGSGLGQFDSPFEAAWRMVADYTADGEGSIYLACMGGIMRTVDGGESWEMVLGSETGSRAYYTDIALADDGTLYAALGDLGYDDGVGSWDAVDRGIWRSEDGENWENITPQHNQSFVDRIVLGTAPSDSSLLYTVITGRSQNGDVYSLMRYKYLSGDGTGSGGEWSDRTANIPDDPETDRSWGNDYNPYGGFCMSIDVHPIHSDVVFLGGSNLFRSTDGFASSDNTTRMGGYRTDYYPWAFNPVRAWYWGHHPDHHGIVFWPGDSLVAMSFTDGGPHLTLDALADSVEWFWYDWGYVTAQFRSVAIDRDVAGDRTVIAGAQDNNFLARYHAADNFRHLYAGDGAFGEVDIENRSLYVTNIDGDLWRVKLDEEGYADSAGFVAPAGATAIRSMFPFRLDPNQKEILYLADGNQLWRNSNILEISMTTNDLNPVSTNWTKLTETFLFLADGADRITALATTTTMPAHRLYYGRSGGRVHRLDDAKEGNPTPVDITGDDFPAGFVNCIAVDPHDGDRAIVVFSNYNIQSLFLTEDAGETWTAVGGNLEDNLDGTGDGPATTWCEIAYRGGEQIYLLGTATGLFTTTELNGANTVWQAESEDRIGRIIIEQIAYREVDGTLLVATHGNGLYGSQVTLGVDDWNDQQAAQTLGRLAEISPNPLRDQAAVSYEIGAAGVGRMVGLEVYNVRGELLLEQSMGRGEEGAHRVEVDASTWSPGLYVVRLSVGDQVTTRRVIRE